MKKHINKEMQAQAGQAVMEMCICLIPILVVLLGMIVISGLGISNIEAFLEAKANAETASRLSGAAGGAGEMIYSWDYGDPDNDGDGYPFTADDEPVNFSQANAAGNTYTLADTILNNITGSQSLAAEADDNANQYIFMATSSVVNDNNFAGNLPQTMVAAAALVRGSPNSGLNTVFTLNTSNKEAKNITPAFTALFGLDLSDIDLVSMRANTVYYPVLPPPTTAGSN
ncbi:MAG: hypothetical protein PHV59_08615 [Victivallales bacterium]|nr:hypothetical protein [Victivallales bacterium]